MTAPERIWAGEGEYWHKPHIVNPTAEYVLHTRAALAASPVVQDMIRQAVEAEREACIELCERVSRIFGLYGDAPVAEKTAETLAATIRARKVE